MCHFLLSSVSRLYVLTSTLCSTPSIQHELMTPSLICVCVCVSMLRNRKSQISSQPHECLVFQGRRRLSEEKQTAFVRISVFSHLKQIRVQGQKKEK